MGNYSGDRSFTNYVHTNIALPIIYKPLKWLPIKLNPEYAEQIDIYKGIDYIFTYNGEIKTVQERFREIKYAKFSDFTVRYRRDTNKYMDRKESEYYKMKAKFFIYGITNGLKNELSTCTDFVKFAVIDMEKVYDKISNSFIKICDNGKNRCQITADNVIECPIKYNPDGSSSFFPIEISFLIQLFGNDIVVAQKGFMPL